MPLIDSQGNTFTFASTVFTVTNVSVTYGGSLIDISHLNLNSGKGRAYTTPPLFDNEISIDYFVASGVTSLVVGLSGTLSFSGIAKSATVSSSSLTYAAGELVKGSVTFKVDA
jgi:hypothetical protein